ncbi:hypothetical protein K432DRAFT_459744 [Lepidopterella palustris CBS 459.81]|uniref:Uncharacterized protein n=1 Tax=Lepidopterella palustris CBS 459.81 TaxID=1314670 RepID=A0A8E2ELV2_9PEZI|nr:hypothetical protein K432DRAFT_459744 [Lepidopterella palustris CBS 459.81]
MGLALPPQKLREAQRTKPGSAFDSWAPTAYRPPSHPQGATSKSTPWRLAAAAVGSIVSVCNTRFAVTPHSSQHPTRSGIFDSLIISLSAQQVLPVSMVGGGRGKKYRKHAAWCRFRSETASVAPKRLDKAGPNARLLHTPAKKRPACPSTLRRYGLGAGRAVRKARDAACPGHIPAAVGLGDRPSGYWRRADEFSRRPPYEHCGLGEQHVAQSPGQSPGQSPELAAIIFRVGGIRVTRNPYCACRSLSLEKQRNSSQTKQGFTGLILLSADQRQKESFNNGLIALDLLMTHGLPQLIGLCSSSAAFWKNCEASSLRCLQPVTGQATIQYIVNLKRVIGRGPVDGPSRARRLPVLFQCPSSSCSAQPGKSHFRVTRLDEYIGLIISTTGGGAELLSYELAEHAQPEEREKHREAAQP